MTIKTYHVIFHSWIAEGLSSDADCNVISKMMQCSLTRNLNHKKSGRDQILANRHINGNYNDQGEILQSFILKFQ